MSRYKWGQRRLEESLLECLCQSPQLLLVFEASTTIYKELLHPLTKCLEAQVFEIQFYNCWQRRGCAGAGLVAGCFLPLTAKMVFPGESRRVNRQGARRSLPRLLKHSVLWAQFHQGWFYKGTDEAATLFNLRMLKRLIWIQILFIFTWSEIPTIMTF